MTSAELEARVEMLENRVSPTPVAESEAERVARLSKVYEAMFSKPKYCNPLAGYERSANAPVLIKNHEWPKFTTEDRDHAFVQVGSMQSFCLEPSQRAKDQPGY